MSPVRFGVWTAGFFDFWLQEEESLRTPLNFPRGYFITATDTGVGKTTVTAALACALQNNAKKVGIMKPIETGVGSRLPSPSDAERLRTVSDQSVLPEEVCVYSFGPSLAPLSAANMTGQMIDLERILSIYETVSTRVDYMLVEGVGGVLVPLSIEKDVRDLIQLLQLPTLVVGRATLGGVNHARLTLEALTIRQIHVAAIVLNHSSPEPNSNAVQEQTKSTIELMKALSGVPVYGPLSYESQVKHDWMAGINLLQADPAITQLAGCLDGNVL